MRVIVAITLLLYLKSVATFAEKDLWKVCLRTAEQFLKAGPYVTEEYLNSVIREKENHWILEGLKTTLEILTNKEKDYISRLKRLYKLKPSDADVNFWLGMVYLKRNQLREAARFIYTATNLNPTSPSFNLASSIIAFKLGEISKSYNYFKLATKKEKNIMKLVFFPSPARGFLNYIYNCIADFPEKETIKLLHVKLLIKVGLYDEALEILGSTTELESLFLKGELYAIYNKDEKAIQFLETVLKRIPFHFEAIKLLAKLYIRVGRLDDAILLLNRATEVYFNSDELLLLKGDVYYRKGMITNIVKELEYIQSKDNPFYKFLKGSLYLKQKNYNDALKACQEALNLNPIFLEAINCLAEGEIGRGNLNRGNRLLQIYSKLYSQEKELDRKLKEIVDTGNILDELNNRRIPEEQKLIYSNTLKSYIQLLKNSNFLSADSVPQNLFIKFISSINYIQWLKKQHGGIYIYNFSSKDVKFQKVVLLPYIVY